MPKSFYDGSTGVFPFDNCIKKVLQNAYSNHIERLMILGNFMLLCEINPNDIYKWFMEMYIDSSEWVMVPNVIGMGVHADGGVMMTKPYAAGGAYISRMTNYCKGCFFDPKKRTGDDACPFTTLYWDFLDRNREGFARNHRRQDQLRAGHGYALSAAGVIFRPSRRWRGGSRSGVPFPRGRPG